MTTQPTILLRTAWAAIRYARAQARRRKRTERVICRESVRNGERAVGDVQAVRPQAGTHGN